MGKNSIKLLKLNLIYDLNTNGGELSRGWIDVNPFVLSEYLSEKVNRMSLVNINIHRV